MSFPLEIPSPSGIRSCRVSRQSVVAVNKSPFTLEEQVYAHPGKAWMISLEIRPMRTSEAGGWIQFLYDINGREGTFNFNLTPHCPGLSPAPGVKVFRLNDNNQGWDKDIMKHYGFSLSATEVVG
jgi:hypothetical protein